MSSWFVKATFPHSELSGPSSLCVFVCLCVFWRQPLDHSETRRTRTGQRLSHYLLFLSLLSPVPLFHVLCMLALSPPFPLLLYSLPLLIHISIRSLHQLALLTPPFKLFPEEWHKTKVPRRVHVFLERAHKHESIAVPKQGLWAAFHLVWHDFSSKPHKPLSHTRCIQVTIT